MVLTSSSRLVLLIVLCCLCGTLSCRRIALCALYQSQISGLGFSFYAHKAFRSALLVLREQYPDDVFSYVSVPNFRLAKNKSQVLRELFNDHACNVLWSTSQYNFDPGSSLLEEFAQAYPETTFYANYYMESGSPNIVVQVIDSKEVWFELGAIAGGQSKSCVGMIVPGGRNLTLANMAVNGMYLGVRVGQSSVPFVVLAINAFSNEPLERLAAELLVKYGCDVIAHWTDSSTVERYVEDLHTNVMSIGAWVDQFKLIGDTVLSSLLYSAAFMAIKGAQRALANETSLPTTEFFNYLNKSVYTATLSPRANPAAQLAQKVALSELDALGSGIFCVEQLRKATAHGGCPTMADAISTVFPTIDGPKIFPLLREKEECPPGTFYSYSLDPGIIELSCILCPKGMYSESAGSSFCKQCPSWTSAEPGSSRCSAARVLYGVLLSVLLASLFGVAVIWSIRRCVRVHPPTTPVVALCVIGMEMSNSVRHGTSFLMCRDSFAAILQNAADEHNIYISSTVGDICVVASSFPAVVYMFLRAVKNAMVQMKNWPCSVSIKAVVHVGCPTTATRKIGNDVRTVYGGADGEIVKVMYGVVQGGGVWLSDDTARYHHPDEAKLGRTLIFQFRDSLRCVVELLSMQHNEENPTLFTETAMRDVELSDSFPGSPRSRRRAIAQDVIGSVTSASPSDFTTSEAECATEFFLQTIWTFARLLTSQDEIKYQDKMCRRLHVRTATHKRPGNPTILSRESLSPCWRRIAQALLWMLDPAELDPLFNHWKAAHEESRSQVRSDI